MSRAPGAMWWLVVALAFSATCFPDADKLRAIGAGAGGIGGGGSSGSGGTTDGSTDGTGDSGSRDGTAGAGGMGGAGGAGGTGGTAGTGGTGGAMQSKTEACLAYADAIVSTLDRCSVIGVELLYGTLGKAKERLRLICSGAELGGANFPKRPVEPCLAAMGAIDCQDFLDDRIPAACLAAGDYPAGTRCTSGDQCQSGLCDLTTRQGNCGQCLAAAPTAGQPCFQGRFCARGLLCSAAGTCATPGEAGATCDASRPCRNTLVCTVGTCVAKGDVGDFCDVRADCNEVHGAVCNQGLGQCVELTVGTPCGAAPDGMSATACAANGTCQAGGCQPAAADNAACNDTNGPFCMNPASCIGGTCQLASYDATCVRTAGLPAAATKGSAPRRPGIPRVGLPQGLLGLPDPGRFLQRMVGLGGGGGGRP